MSELDKLKILLAWQAGELSEGQVSKILGIGRIEARELMDRTVSESARLGEALFMASKAGRTTQ